MNRVLAATMAAMVMLSGVLGSTAQESGPELFLYAFQSNPLTEGDPTVGDACKMYDYAEPDDVFPTVPLFMTIENEQHDVVAAWQVTGEIIEAPNGNKPCATPENFSLPIPAAKFWLVYLNDEFIAAYSPDTLPDDHATGLTLYMDIGD